MFSYQSKMPQNKLLSPEEFVERDPNDPVPRYNDLILYFITTGIGSKLRETPHFLGLQRERPDLEKRLTEGIMNRDVSIPMEKALIPFEPDLYEAYKIMRRYGALDEDLYIRSE